MVRFLILSVLPFMARADILWNDVCTQPDVMSSKWCDTALPIPQRAAAFVAALEPNEKIPIMTNEAQGVARLHIPPYQWGSEGLHGPLEPCVCGMSKATGKNKCACPTSFPAPSAMGSAYNTSLYWMIGHNDGMEARAINNNRDHKTQNNYGDGIDYWSPTVNMQRDPRWGRNQEVPGEDPHLTGMYAQNFVNGLQGDPHPNFPKGVDPNHTMIVATCKHFIANSLENWEGHTRHNFNAIVPLSDMADYYLPSFKTCVMDGKVKGIMCSYNAVNGVPMCANPLYLNETLRNQWGFEGYVTSDCDAVADVYEQHHYASPVNGTALSLKAGTDMDCGDFGDHAYLKELPAALEQGLITENDLDTALIRLTRIQMDLGLFDPKADQMFFHNNIDLVGADAHRELAKEAAQQSIVLLKNDGDILPLKPGKNIAVIGPHSSGNEVFLSNYHGSACLNSTGGITGKNFDCIQTPLDAITKANVGGKTVGAMGCPVNGNAVNISAIVAAQAADIVVMVMGIDGSIEAEGRDRTTTTLPGVQPQLVQAILDLKKPTVLVLVNGGTISLGNLAQSPAILECFYGGEMAASAMASVLFGDYNPTGRMATTVYPPEFVTQVPLTQMSVTQPPGRTHLYYTGKPEFKFGDGLSYSKWQLDWTHEQQPSMMSTSAEDSSTFTVSVSNVGDVSGGINILAFWKPVGHPSPLRQKLFAFDGLRLFPGGKGTLDFVLKADDLAIANDKGDRVLTQGEYVVEFRGFSDMEVISTSLTIHGEARIVESYSL